MPQGQPHTIVEDPRSRDPATAQVPHDPSPPISHRRQSRRSSARVRDLSGWVRRVASVPLALAVLAGFPASVSGAPSVEQELAESYSPVLSLEPQDRLCGQGEAYRPTSVDIVLGRRDVSLRDQRGNVVKRGPTASDLWSARWTDRRSVGAARVTTSLDGAVHCACACRPRRTARRQAPPYAPRSRRSGHAALIAESDTENDNSQSSPFTVTPNTTARSTASTTEAEPPCAPSVSPMSSDFR
jgi:hypothetical protein